jgi:prevent-host-death family protein
VHCASARVARYFDAASTEPVIITKHGRNHTALLSAAMLDTLVRVRSLQKNSPLDPSASQAIDAGIAALNNS